MNRPSKSFLFSALAVMGWVLLALAVSGVTDAVVIEASEINNANSTTTPSLNNLINCSYQTSDGVIANNSAADFVLVDCSDVDGAMIALSDCNSALTAVSGVDLGGNTTATAMPILPYSVSDATLATAGTIAVYGGRIDFSVATGVAFQVNLRENSTPENADAIKAVIQGLRGLVTLSGDPLPSLPVAIFAVDSTDTTNPCSEGVGDLFGINVAAQYDLSPNTVPYLILNVVVSNTTDLCDVEATNVFGTSSVDGSFSTNESAICYSGNFGTGAPDPQLFYPLFFVNVTVNPSNPTALLTGVAGASDLNFYPNLDANGSAASTTDLTSAVACVNSTDSGLSQFGGVDSLVVRCENLHEAEDLETHYKDCQTALYSVRALIGADTRLLISVRLSGTWRRRSCP